MCKHWESTSSGSLWVQPEEQRGACSALQEETQRAFSDGSGRSAGCQKHLLEKKKMQKLFYIVTISYKPPGHDEEVPEGFNSVVQS